jgi:hypothetical protein
LASFPDGTEIDLQGIEVGINLAAKFALKLLNPFPELRDTLDGRVWFEGRRYLLHSLCRGTVQTLKQRQGRLSTNSKSLCNVTVFLLFDKILQLCQRINCKTSQVTSNRVQIGQPKQTHPTFAVSSMLSCLV